MTRDGWRIPDHLRSSLFISVLLSASHLACSAADPPPPIAADRVAIADLAEALTFARAGGRVIAVTEYRDGVVRGVDTGSGDAIALVNEVPYDELVRRIRAAPEGARVSVRAEELEIPIDVGEHHIAAATNFPEHAGDAGVEDGPFLFAKMVRPTGPYAEVSAGSGLLDYEVEVAWVTLAPLRPGETPERVGLVLCNDFTDRDTLLRHLDPWNVESGDGFTTGKSFPGFLPLGNLFVVPRDHRRFVDELELKLDVDGEPRQRSRASEMVWDLDEVLAQTWARRDQRWQHRGAQVALHPGGDAIPARTLILAGTPHGTAFDGIATAHYAAGLASWLLGGWDRPLPSHVVDAYLADARAEAIYLQPGDEVVIHVDRMGLLRNPVVP